MLRKRKVRGEDWRDGVWKDDTSLLQRENENDINGEDVKWKEDYDTMIITGLPTSINKNDLLDEIREQTANEANITAINAKFRFKQVRNKIVYVLEGSDEDGDEYVMSSERLSIENDEVFLPNKSIRFYARYERR